MENKKEICELLLKACQRTDFLGDLVSLEYCKKETDPNYPRLNGLETVTATFKNGCKKKVNVDADSGYSMIRDTLKGLA